MKRFQINDIRHMRSIRDEILTCKNSGRLRKLIDSYPGVSGYSFVSGGWSESRITVRLNTGHEFIKYSDNIFGAAGM